MKLTNKMIYMIVPSVAFSTYFFPDKNKAGHNQASVHAETGKANATYQDYFFCWMNEKNTIRQVLTGIYIVAQNAMIGIATPFLTGVAGVEYIGTGHCWLIPDAIAGKDKAKSVLQKILNKNTTSNQSTSKLLLEAKTKLTSPQSNHQLKIAIKKLEIASQSISCQKWYTAIGYGLLTSAITAFLTPGLSSTLFHYTPLIAGAAATYLVGIVTLGVGAIAIKRGYEMYQRADKSQKIEKQMLKDFREIGETLYTQVSVDNLESKKTQIKQFLQNNCALENGADTYTQTTINNIQTLDEMKTYLKDLDKAIATKKFKQWIARFIGGSMIVAGLGTLAAAGCTFGKSIIVANIISIAAAAFYVSMESTFCLYDSSWIFKSYFDTFIYREPDWMKELQPISENLNQTQAKSSDSFLLNFCIP